MVLIFLEILFSKPVIHFGAFAVPENFSRITFELVIVVHDWPHRRQTTLFLETSLLKLKKHIFQKTLLFILKIKHFIYGCPTVIFQKN